jgi:acyl-CoA dehydrogenase
VDFTLDEDVAAIADQIVRFIDREVVTLEEQNKALLSSERAMFDDGGRYVPRVLELRKQVRMRSAELGFYTLFGAASLGGSEMGALASSHIQEVLYRRYGPDRPLIHAVVIPSPFTNGLSPVLRTLPEAVFARYRDAIASGEKTLCMALSEPDAGSDVYAMKTRAARDGAGWRLSGVKQWITNAPYADYTMAFAITDLDKVQARKGGITGFFVDMKSQGVAVPSIIPVMGHLGGDTALVTFDEVYVPDDHRLGDVDAGLRVAIGGVSAGRLGMAASCLGLAQWALDRAVEYAKVRKTFGVPIGKHQAIQFMLAECAMDIYAAKCMIQNCSWRIDAGQSPPAQISMVKAFATEMVGRVTDRCVQMHGGMGVANEARLEGAFRTARIMRIPDGTGEIQRRIIAREILADRADI